MPYQFIPAAEPKTDPALVAALADELRLKRPDGPSDAPLIREEQVSRSDYLYITVIWDKWRDVGAEDRSRIILNAYEQVGGAEAARKISVALGLTHAESQRLGVAI